MKLFALSVLIMIFASDICIAENRSKSLSAAGISLTFSVYSGVKKISGNSVLYSALSEKRTSALVLIAAFIASFLAALAKNRLQENKIQKNN
jgi:uncharacterized membrane protein